jgi:hypothetical protein
VVLTSAFPGVGQHQGEEDAGGSVAGQRVEKGGKVDLRRLAGYILILARCWCSGDI